MFRKSLTRAVALTTMSAAVVAIGMQASFAGGYGGGYGKHHRYEGGYSRAPSHISHRKWGQHVNWCQEHFVTYRAHDNTYQPYSGPRRQCWSPYISG